MARVLLLVGLIFIVEKSLSFQYKRALNLIAKGSLEQAEEIAIKSLQKDTLNPGAKYIRSLLFSHGANPNYNLDSSYYLIQESIEEYKLLAEKELEKLQKAEIQETELINQKLKVDSMSYEVYLVINTEDGYIEFLDKFKGAIQEEDAIIRRNNRAYKTAERKHTYQDYAAFMEKYPDAIQVPDAKINYEKLLYNDQTFDGKLESYINFLKENPNTPHREEAETNIYHLKTANNYIEDYYWYIKNYSHSHWVVNATNLAYHIFKENNPPKDFDPGTIPQSLKDSLGKVIKLEGVKYFPFLVDDRYGLMDENGKEIVQPIFRDLDEKHLCEPLDNDILIARKEQDQILGLNGKILFSGQLEDVSDLGYGFIKIKSNGYYYLIHKSGFRVFDQHFDDLGLIDGKLFTYKKNSRWGILNYAGNEILPADYDDIYQLGSFVIIEKNERIAVTNVEQLIEANKSELPFTYDEVELLEDGHLLCFSGSNEALIDTYLDEIIPLKEQEISEVDLFWIIRQDSLSILIDKDFPQALTSFNQLYYDDQWLALKKGKKWSLSEINGDINPMFIYDSLNLICEDILYVEKEDSVFAWFSQEIKLDLRQSNKIQLLKPSEKLSDYSHNHLLSVDNDHVKRLYNHQGKKILAGWFDKISVVNDFLFIIEKDGKKGISDTTGLNVLPIEYDAIGDYNQGNISILKDGKFGIFNYQRGLLVDPSYDFNIRIYNDSTLIAGKDGKFGLIDLKENEIIPFNNQQIIYWNSQQALVQKEDNWYLQSFFGDSTLVKDFEFIINSPVEKRMIFLGEDGYGLISSQEGIIIDPVFSEIINIGTAEEPFYLASKYMEQAGLHVLVYYNHKGERVRRQALTEEEFDKIICEKG